MKLTDGARPRRSIARPELRRGWPHRIAVSMAIPVAFLMALTGCSNPASQPPNVLWIVWDTVRADHLSLYGYPRSTTPFLDTWAQQARVFENTVSPGTITLTSHGSFFTGLPSTEHGADNGLKWLDEKHVTIAEHLKAAGYRTFLWSANPHISKEANFHQGFDVSLHPWDARFQERARQIILDKVSGGDRSSELPERIHDKRKNFEWDIKASGILAREAFTEWLGETRKSQPPYFAFINYMEAHRPRIPPERFRTRMMSPEDVERSYVLDQSWDAIWNYTFQAGEYSDDDLRIMAAVYDATLAELDELLEDLLGTLGENGQLENTVVVLTSDHGEHLGEQHMLDHQYSVYEPLVRVPLIVHYPDRFDPGRDSRPVMSHDLFPTLLELAGLDADVYPSPQGIRGASLLNPRPERPRLSEYVNPFGTAFKTMVRSNPDWDPKPWKVKLRALTLGHTKLIRKSNGEVELYDLEADPDESNNLATTGHPQAADMKQLLRRQVETLTPWKKRGQKTPEFSPEHRRRLEALGYLTSSDAEDPAGDSRPAAADESPP